ncbi:MAG: DUF2800 domain-containing protein [Eubacteriales bacterium]|nr:DUF2800 domain-containing protein [Eubacteriales bacterium]
MNWNRHSEIEGSHAFLSASKYHWINYDDERLVEAYNSFMAAERGTELHDFAARCINLRQKLPRSAKTLNSYVNDAIGYRMQTEQSLYYSDNCYGTADSISFDGKLLRIHDLKTGKIPAKMEQLMVYAALFCLEYKIDPSKITMELRIYQNDEVVYFSPDYKDINEIIKKIKRFDVLIEKIKGEM